MQAEKSELQKIIQTLWSSELYKIILSNPTGDGTYRKIVLNRQKKGWQAEQYTEKQVFHENLPEGKVQDYLMANMSSAFRQCGAWDGTFEHTVRISKKGKVTGMKKRPNGLMIGQKRVPLGVVGIIYEARPNVTADAFGLCFKTGNVVILKGGSDALHSNEAIVNCIRETLGAHGVTENAIQLIADTSRETAAEFMKMNEYVDVLIPRGGKGLIKAVVNQSTIPVIETGTGNCHIYVDESADLDMAVNIILNAKTQRVGVCNACESLLVHENVKEKLLPVLAKRLQEKHVEMRADKEAQTLMPGAVAATEEDWGTEYLDYILSIKVVHNVDERSHISISTIPVIQRRLSQRITAMHRNSWMKWMQPLYM